MMTPMAPHLPHPAAHRSGGPSFARRALLALALSAGVLGSAPGVARASSDDDVEHYDGRVQGYSPDAEAKSSSVGLTYVLVVLLGAGCVGVLFMNPRRSHLD